MEEKEIFIEMYKEQCAHARHHEAQRTAMSNLILLIATAIIAFVTFDKDLSVYDLPLTIVLVFLGFFGSLFSVKFQERFRHHMSRARAFRDAVGTNLRDIKRQADLRFEETNGHIKWVRNYDLTRYWILLHCLVSFIGIVLSFIILIR